MVDDPEVAGDDFVLEDGSVWDVDPVPVVGDHDHRPFQHHVPAEVDVARHRQMVQLKDLKSGLSVSKSQN